VEIIRCLEENDVVKRYDVHDGNHIFPSYQISCKEVLTIIEGKIKVE